MKLKMTFLFLIMMFSTAGMASADCIPANVIGDSSSSCAHPEVVAGRKTLAMIQSDVSELLKSSPKAQCLVEPSRALRLLEENGNQGKDLKILILTKVTCKSEFFVQSSLHQFPVLVSLWTNHSETETANLEIQRLYDPL